MSDFETTESSDEGHLVVPREWDGFARRAWRGRPGWVDQFVGIVRAGPPSPGMGADYNDARYWIDRAVVDPGTPPRGALRADIDALSGVGQTITATNLAELAGGTHLLAAGTLVQVWGINPRSSSPGTKVYGFNLPPTRSVAVRITTASSGAGEYSGVILEGMASATAGSNLAMPMGMTMGLTGAGADNALILNVDESGETGNRLAAGSYAVGIVAGVTAESPARSIVLMGGGVGSTAGAGTLGGTTDASETAQTTSWSRAASAMAVNLWVVSRVVYNAGGDRSLYAFLREMSFDARGLLTAISAETRVTVDATEACA